MKNNNWYNHVQSQRDNFHPIDRYLRDTARDEALIRSYGLDPTFGASSNSYASYRHNAAEKACTALDNIKSNHIRNLNNKILSSLREVLSEPGIASIQSQDCTINSPSILAKNPTLKNALQSNPNLLSKYHEITSKVIEPIDAKKQQILQINQGGVEHVEASQNLFTQTFRVDEYFEYLDNKVQAPICKPIVTEIAEAITQNINDILLAESQGSQGESPLPSNATIQEADEHEEDSQSVQVSNFTAEEVISMNNKPASSHAQSQAPQKEKSATNTPSIEELMARIRELEAVNSELQNKVDNSIDPKKVQEIVQKNKEDMDAIAIENQEKDDLMKDIKKTSGDKDKTIEDQNKAMKDKDDVIKSQADDNKIISNKLADSQKINQIQEKTIDGLEKDKSKLEKTNEKLETKVDKLEDKVEDLAKEVKEKDGKISELQQAKLEELLKTVPKGISSDWDMLSDEIKSKSSKTSRSSKYKTENKQLKDTVEILKGLLVEKNVNIDLAKLPSSDTLSIDKLLGQNEPEKDLLGASNDIEQVDF